jgi:DNA adenine methylase
MRKETKWNLRGRTRWPQAFLMFLPERLILIGMSTSLKITFQKSIVPDQRPVISCGLSGHLGVTDTVSIASHSEKFLRRPAWRQIMTRLCIQTTKAVSPKPFLKWAGGKRQLLPTILPALPADFDLSVHRFFEPFMGGAALTWALATDQASAMLLAPKGKTRRPLVLNDANTDLVTTYRVIQDDPEALITMLRGLEHDTSASAYYNVRAREPTDRIERAARTIFLNKLGFNGLHRVNGSGKYNVSYGKVMKSSIFDPDLLRACAGWLQHVEVRSGNYVTALSDARGGDVVYLDPPYIPLTPTAGFTAYTLNNFLEMDQWALAGVIRGLIARGVRVILSNSNAELTRSIYGTELNLFAVSATRKIGASKSSRAAVKEVLGISYDPTTSRNPAVLAKLHRLTTANPVAKVSS